MISAGAEKEVFPSRGQILGSVFLVQIYHSPYGVQACGQISPGKVRM